MQLYLNTPSRNKKKIGSKIKHLQKKLILQQNKSNLLITISSQNKFEAPSSVCDSVFKK